MKNIKLILKIAYTTGDGGMLNQIYIYYSETNEPNRIKHGFAESELFQYFDIFMSSIEPNSKKHRNIEKIRFGSIFLECSRVSL